MKVEKEDFEEWLENPITQAVLNGMKRHAELYQDVIKERVWNSGYLTTERQVELAGEKAAILSQMDIASITYEDYQQRYEDQG